MSFFFFFFFLLFSGFLTVTKGVLYGRFKKQLEALKAQDPLSRAREETVNLRTFEANVSAIRERRSEYRRMLADALAQVLCCLCVFFLVLKHSSVRTCLTR
jgi:hypothetical protein